MRGWDVRPARTPRSNRRGLSLRRLGLARQPRASSLGTAPRVPARRRMARRPFLARVRRPSHADVPPRTAYTSPNPICRYQGRGERGARPAVAGEHDRRIADHRHLVCPLDGLPAREPSEAGDMSGGVFGVRPDVHEIDALRFGARDQRVKRGKRLCTERRPVRRDGPRTPQRPLRPLSRRRGQV